MQKTIYHGSNKKIETPIFGAGKPYNDYGLGFYCTEDLNMAKEWGVTLTSNGYANEYKLEMEGLKVLNLNSPEYNMLHWLCILLENRTFDIYSPLGLEAYEYILENFMVPYEKYDVIIGYRADDSYFSFANDFLNGSISYRQLCTAMKLGNLGEQIVLKSKKAYKNLTFKNAYRASKEEWYPKKEHRDLKARRDYLDSERHRRQKGDIFVADIIDEEMKGNDPRLQ